MFKKPFLIASAAALIATATFSTQAKAGDPIVGALIGGAIGAAIGHDVNGRHGAGVGGAIGAIAGASIASDHGRYYDRGYGYGYYEPAPRYYGPAYAPAYGYGYGYAPVYPRATIVYSSGPRYGHRHYRNWDRRHDRRGYRY